MLEELIVVPFERKQEGLNYGVYLNILHSKHRTLIDAAVQHRSISKGGMEKGGSLNFLLLASEATCSDFIFRRTSTLMKYLSDIIVPMG